MKSFLASLLLIGALVLVSIESFSISRKTVQQLSKRLSSKTNRRLTSATTTTTTTTLRVASAGGALEVDATSEVVGGYDSRIGSLFLKEDGAIAVPRGVTPGCLTRSANVGSSSNDDGDGGAPIIVAIPSRDWKAIFDMTPSHRRSDLVWIDESPNNGLLSSWQRHATVVLPHFGELQAGDESVTSPASSPPTYYYAFGKHATAVAAVLTKRSSRGEKQVVSVVVESWTEMCHLAARRAANQSDNDNQSDTSKTRTVTSSDNPAKLKVVPIPAIDLVGYGEQMNTTNSDDRGGRGAAVDEIQSAVVVGGGIIGSSIARALAQHRGVKEVTVYDPTPTGKTTPASWAWLNANQKPPHSYMSLNQLGLRGWRSDALLESLPSWTGTLVCTETKKLELNGGYTAEGPLSLERIRELEPEANFTAKSGNVYYFADEGHVNPHEAVLALRDEAIDNGVSFVSDERVVGLVRNEDGRVVGVKASRDDGRETEKLADVVIVAAGANSSDAALGAMPLVHNPSRTCFASPCASSSTGASSSSPAFLRRILVDMGRALYIAQRKDGTLVAGGGALKFGLSATASNNRDELLSPEEVQTQMTMAQDLAQQLAPNPVGNSSFTHKEEAVKPMPRDGFPILGYSEAGLYSAVTHSGMTMAPLIGQLVAAEVKEQVSLSILDDYRPARFDK